MAKFTVNRLDFFNLSTDEQTQWIDRLYEVCKHSIANADKEGFYKFSFGSSELERAYYVIETSCGKVASFFTIEYYTFEQKGKPTTFFNTSISIAPAYRGKGLILRAMLQFFKDFTFLASRGNVYWISSSINPVSYHAVADIAWKLYPHIDAPIPTELLPVLEKYSELFHKELSCTSETVKFVGGPSLLVSEQQRQRMKQSDKKHIQYYLSQDIDFERGEGMPIIIPASFSNIVGTIFKIVKKHLTFKVSRFTFLQKTKPVERVLVMDENKRRRGKHLDINYSTL